MPSVANIFSPIAAVLIDPVTGQPYRYGAANTTSTFSPNISSPVAAVPVDPVTGVPYR